jgi:hypothetical protein
MLSKIKIILSLIILSTISFAQVPILNSAPSITNKVIYLDFDGQKVIGTSWNSGNLVDAQPSTLNNANKILVWKRVSEDYRPFDVNVTTDSTRFNNASPNSRIRVVITPTSAWYGSAGGVAFVGSFIWGGTPGTPCWIFENMLNYNSKSVAEACSHEVGHTLTLRHQSVYNNACTKTAEYNPGLGNGVTSWAPIMGVGYSKNVTVWSTGRSATGCNVIQTDHGNSGIGITSANFLNFLQDDVGDNLNTAKILNLTSVNLIDSGLITEPTDLDAYRFTICNSRYVSIAVKPWALDTTNYSGANLDVRLYLYDATNSVLAVDTPLSKLHSLVGMNLNAGTYYFTIDGGRSSNYTDYGSLGKYYISIKATNPPALANTIVTPTTICAGQNIQLNYTSNGTPTQWQWLVSGPSANTFTTQNPSLAFSVGIHTISLLATSGVSLSCETTVTLNIGAPPTLSLTNASNVLCNGRTLTLSAVGAASYTWFPGGFSGANQIVSPLVNTTYTIFGSNGTCMSSIVNSVTVSPDFTLTSSATSSLICAGESVTITSNGANTYTISPGNITANPAVVTPIFPTSFIVAGEVSGCVKNKIIPVDLSDHFDLYLTISNTLVCEGQPVDVIMTGGNSYTYSPGNLNGYSVTLNPNTTTTYTVLAADNGACIEDTVFTIAVKQCDFTSVRQNTSNTKIKIYPNPVKGNLIISGNFDNSTIKILDVNGRLVYSKLAQQKIISIPTESWSKGVYFVKINTEGEGEFIEKIIVE